MVTFIQNLTFQLKKKEIQAIPEVLAFNFMMALIPMLIIFFQILAFLSIETTVLDETLAGIVPEDVYIFMMDFLDTASIDFRLHPVLLITTVVTLTLTISKGVNGIFKAFLITYDETVDVPGFKHRIAAVLTFFLLLAFAAVATLFLTTSHVLFQNMPSVIATVVELFVFALLCLIFFYLLFRLAPNKKKSFKDLIPGTLVTSIGFIATTMIFTFYVDRLANFHLIYGTLSIIIILLTWLFLLGWVINVGIQTNYVMQYKDCLRASPLKAVQEVANSTADKATKDVGKS